MKNLQMLFPFLLVRIQSLLYTNEKLHNLLKQTSLLSKYPAQAKLLADAGGQYKKALELLGLGDVDDSSLKLYLEQDPQYITGKYVGLAKQMAKANTTNEFDTADLILDGAMSLNITMLHNINLAQSQLAAANWLSQN